MKTQIDSLESNEHQQLYEIIKRHTDAFTVTPTGVFVSTDILPATCLEEIEKHIQFCIDQRKRMDEDTLTRKTYEKLFS